MAGKVMERIKGVDLYKLLEIEIDADDKAIKKAYRKKALKCHPDKNPDNPRAAEEFHLLSDAYEVLADADTKKAYDNVLKAKKAAEVRNRQLDAKRRKLKDDLEARESEAAREQQEKVYKAWSDKTEEARLAEEIERLRGEGRRRLEEEQEAMRREIEEEEKKRRAATAAADQQQTPAPSGGGGPVKLKVKWKAKDGEETVYDASKLKMIFSKYGEVLEAVVLPGKKGKMSGLVEMRHGRSAQSAARIESGFPAAPLKVSVMGEAAAAEATEVTAASAPATAASVASNNDFESLVMMRLRQEEMRKKEIQRIMEEDAREEEEQKAKNK